MRGVVSRFIVRPAVSGTLHAAGAFVVTAVMSSQSGLDASSIARVLSVALPSMAAYGFGASRSVVEGFRYMLVEKRWAAQAVPGFLLSRVELTENDVKECQEVIGTFFRRPPFVADIWVLRFAWRIALGTLVNVELIETMPVLLQQEMRAAKQRGEKRIDTKIVAETILLQQVDMQLSAAISKMTKYGYAGLLVLWVLPLGLVSLKQ